MTLFVNAKVFTGTAEDHFASAFAVHDGRFSWVGDQGALPPGLRGEPVVDLGGATVLPGLLDVHTHPALMAELVEAVSVLPPTVLSMSSLVQTLRAAPACGAGSDVWIRGFGFDDAKYPERRWPTRHDMDRVSTRQPVFVQRCDGHSAVCNTRALELAGITRDTPDPAGAAYGREPDGTPDGRLVEPAAWAPLAALPPVEPHQRIDNLARLGEHFASRGLVGIADLAATFTADPLASFRQAATRAWLPQTGIYLLWPHIAADPPVLSDDDRRGPIHIAGVKVLMDGAYSNATAWCHDPYPGTETHGLRTTTEQQVRDAAAWARANGVQLAAHAMGDAAIDAVLDLFEDEPSWLGERPAVRIEHATLFTPERIERVRSARMRFAVVSHAIFFFAEYDAYAANLSPQQFQVAYPLRSFYERLPLCALSSDNPATAWADADQVFTSIQAAVTRRAWNGADFGQHEAISVAQALLLYTARAAECAGFADLGAITQGRQASFVVLDQDPFHLPAVRLSSVRVAQTWAAGQLVFRR